MVPVIGIIVGATIGAVVLKFGGLLAGAAIGWLIAMHHRQDAALQRLGRDIERLRDRLRELQRSEQRGMPSSQPSPAPVAETVFSWERATVRTAPAAQPTGADDLPQPVIPIPQQPQIAVSKPSETDGGYPQSELEGVLTRLFSTENLLVKLGMAILLIGVSFLVKYAVQHGLLPLEMRLVGAALGGVALIGFGWRLRRVRPEYALVLQGGGVGVLYLVCYAAYRLYSLIPAGTAFGMFVTIAAVCSVLALRQDSRTLVLFGISGGFGAPFLASVGTGNPAVLFGYYAVLNSTVIAIAWFRSWRSLNLTGFGFTFVLSAIWGAAYYTPAHFATVEPFLILFFLIYLAVAILFSLRQPPNLRGYLDATLVFGTPLAACLLQAALVAHYRYGMAWSALSAGLLYLLLFVVLRGYTQLDLLGKSFAAIGGVLLSLAVPLACDGRLTSAVWALEGAALVWAGCRLERRLVRISGYLLQFVSGLAFMLGLKDPVGRMPVLNSLYIGMMLLAVAGLCSGYLVWKNRFRMDAAEQQVEWLSIAWGLLWWGAAGVHELCAHLDSELLAGGLLVFVALSAVTIRAAAGLLDWPALRLPGLLLLPLMLVGALAWLPHHPLANGGWFGWPTAFISGWWLIYCLEEQDADLLHVAGHACLVWLGAVLATWELVWQVHLLFGHQGSWLTIAKVTAPLMLMTVILSGTKRVRWPLARYSETYLGVIMLPLAVWSLVWIAIAAFQERGDSWPLPWLPLLNQLDLTMLLGLALPVLWGRRLSRDDRFAAQVSELGPLAVTLVGLVGFVWLNSLLARGLHHWGGIAFDLSTLLHSPLSQATFSIVWSLLALVAMLYAVRRGLRAVWITGAGLLAVVVGKLFLIDLAGHGTVARIVSFVAVGLLLLVIGWFAPVPPQRS